MTIKEKIFDYLKGMGLMPHYDDDQDIHFNYMMTSMIIVFDEKDEQYLLIILPNIFSVDENNRVDVLEACNTTTRRMKVAKCFIPPHGDTVWITTEQLINKDPELAKILPRTLDILIGARMCFRNEINK